jgi:hypothetical protein
MRAALHRIRKQLGLPPHAGKSEMGSVAGWTETFSAEAIDYGEFTTWLNQEFERILQDVDLQERETGLR